MAKGKYIVRIIHGAISLFFLVCIIQIYMSFFTHTYPLSLLVALIAVNAEGIVVFCLNKGNCPLGSVHKKFGDDKYFFELFFPKHVAKLVIPVVAVITIFGELLLFFQHVFGRFPFS